MKLQRRELRRLILEECGCMSDSLLPPYLEVGDSPIQGVGIFSVTEIPAHTDMGPAHIYLDNGSIDITQLGRHHNHSDSPNCYSEWVDGERHIFPQRDLSPGEEITVDYTMQPDLEQPQAGWR